MKSFILLLFIRAYLCTSGKWSYEVEYDTNDMTENSDIFYSDAKEVLGDVTITDSTISPIPPNITTSSTTTVWPNRTTFLTTPGKTSDNHTTTTDTTTTDTDTTTTDTTPTPGN